MITYFRFSKEEGGEQFADFELDILPSVGDKIRISNLTGEREECVVEDLLWNISEEAGPHVEIFVKGAQ